jgi:hypothetical protein
MNKTRQSLEDFLTAQSGLPPVTHCPSCHALLLHPVETFFLLDCEQSWTIPLSVCPNCDLDPNVVTRHDLRDSPYCRLSSRRLT